MTARANSVEHIEKWISEHSVDCVFIKHHTNKGICKTVNEGLRHAGGEYVALIGTDDVWMLDKLDHQIRDMEQRSREVGVLYSDAYRIDESGSPLPGMYIESMYRQARKDFTGYPEGDIFSALVENNFIPGMTTLIRKHCYDTLGLYDETLCFEDWDMWFRISQHFTFAYSPLVSAKYRIVSTSASRTLLQERRLHERHRLGAGTHSWVLGSNFVLREKCLAYGRISTPDKQELLFVMRWIVERMYEHRLAQRHLYIWKLFRRTRSLWAVSMLLCSVCGFSYSAFNRFYAGYLRSGAFKMRSKLLQNKRHTGVEDF